MSSSKVVKEKDEEEQHKKEVVGWMRDYLTHVVVFVTVISTVLKWNFSSFYLNIFNSLSILQVIPLTTAFIKNKKTEKIFFFSVLFWIIFHWLINLGFLFKIIKLKKRIYSSIGLILDIISSVYKNLTVWVGISSHIYFHHYKKNE